MRSAIAPAKGPTTTNCAAPAKKVRPTAKDEPESSKTSQLCARTSAQREAEAKKKLMKSRRKSRDWKAGSRS